MHAKFWLGWKTVQKWCFSIIGCEGQDWIYVAQTIDQLQGLVNMVMDLQNTQKVGNFLTS
jgi:hypothetical protein